MSTTCSLAYRVGCTVMLLASTVVTADDAAIDQILQRTHRRVGIRPGPICDDSVYLRRVTLDLVGRVPTVAEVKAFTSGGERAKWVDRLLASSEFDAYWSQLWTDLLVGRGRDGRTDRESLRRWLEAAFAKNQPLDQIAFDLISAQGVTALDGPVNFLVANREDPVTPVSRIFLGVQLDCARCHDHPFDRWRQADYTAMKRFFKSVQTRDVSGGVRVFDIGSQHEDGSDPPRFLTGARPRTSAWRRELALMTVRCQPFARAMGNRVWQLLIGKGVVDPADGISDSNPASVPELHQALADQLRGQRFDVRRLIRTICLSDAYARTDATSSGAATESDYQLFAARRPRALLPEQWVLSHHMIVHGERLAADKLNVRAVDLVGRASVSAGASDPLQIDRNSQGLLSELATEIEPPSGQIESLYLATVSRLPDDAERERFGQVAADDLLYALLHCNEFVFSH